MGPNGFWVYGTPEEVRQRMLKRLDDDIAKRTLDQKSDAGYDPKRTLEEAKSLIDQDAVNRFDLLHTAERKKLFERLDVLSNDTIAWLKSEQLLNAVDRYNGLAPDDAKSDGARFAMQLSVALQNLDNSYTGKEFLGSKNPFTWARDNLVARMVGCNSQVVVTEIEAACDQLQASAVANANGAPARDPDEARIKEIQWLVKALDKMTSVVKGAEKALNFYSAPPDPIVDYLKSSGGNSVVECIRTIAASAWSGVLFAAVAQYSIKATQREGRFLAAQAVALTQGLGKEAVKLLQEEAKALAARLGTNPTYSKVGLGRASDWLKKEQQMQSMLEQRVAAVSKGKEVLGVLRVKGLLFVAQGLSAMVGGGGNAMIKQDARSALEAIGQLLSAIGGFRDIRAALCQEMVFKTISPKLGVVEAFAEGTRLDSVAAAQLIRLKTFAGSFTIAGATIGVGLSFFDAARAKNAQNLILTGAYLLQGSGGLSTIAGVAVGMRFAKAVRLATSLNILGFVLTVSSTIIIAALADKTWQSWFKSEPFRLAKYTSDGTLIDRALKPTPHRSQEQMLSKLDEALSDAKEG